MLHSDNIVEGLPWSFEYEGFAVSHETDDCYIFGGELFPRDKVLIIEGKTFSIVDRDQYFRNREIGTNEC